MERVTVQVSVPIESLLAAVAQLSLEDKRRLWETLDQEIMDAEDELLERDPALRAEIEEARAAYEAGDYVTFDQYFAERRGRE